MTSKPKPTKPSLKSLQKQIVGTWRLISAEDRSSTPDSPTPEDALAIFNAYIAYYGTYTIDEANITVQVEGAWDPSQVDTAQARPYELRGDTLIIGDQVTYKRTLKRVK